MTEPASESKPKRAARPRPRKAVAPPVEALEPTHRHPNLGVAPLDLTAGYPAAAATLRRDKEAIARVALTTLADKDPEFGARFVGPMQVELLRDAEVLIERLALSVTSNDPRPMAEYAEWIGPVFRRKRVSLWELASMCAAIRDNVVSRLDPDAAASAVTALDGAIAVLRKNGRVGGDGHKRNPLLRWFYRGV